MNLSNSLATYIPLNQFCQMLRSNLGSLSDIDFPPPETIRCQLFNHTDSAILEVK